MEPRKNFGIGVSVVLLLMISLGCGSIHLDFDALEVGELVTETQTVELDGAESVQVSLNMAGGTLEVQGGSEALMEAEFSYNVAEWAPQVSYSVEDEGQLTVRQPQFRGLPGKGQARNQWSLLFNEDIPLDMRVEYGAGKGTLDLRRLQVGRLNISLGAGDAAVDLSGNTTLTELRAEMGVGSLNINLNGNWDHDVDVRIKGGIGGTELLLPSHIGIRVLVTQGIGNVNVGALQQRDGDYVNALYGESDVTLEIHIEAGLGDVTLNMAE